jgi:poly-gamma-glutamate capsule biosynthesis protein CapA/YwtB (metallophosphatase superfamily)
MRSNASETIRLFLCGDVMTGRGIDQILPHPSNPVLYEPCVRDARDYVRLAEAANGPIRKPVDFAYVWGDALAELRRAGADLRIINLETSITRSEDAWPGKGIHYRMHARNIGCVTAAGIDCCCLANNHVLDWGYEGLAETLRALDEAGVAHAGAGRNAAEAASPAVIHVTGPVPGGGRGPTGDRRVLVFSLGVNLLDDLSADCARRVSSHIGKFKRPGDVAVASIHWGDNWGYDVPAEQIEFAHRLVECGVDIVHGHSSHHVKAMEVYCDRLILYGCGDFLTDYEGICGHERFRGDLALMYLPMVDLRQGRLVEARLVPLRARQFRLNRVSTADAQWLANLLNQLGRRFGTRVQMEGDNSMTLGWR